MTQQTRKGRNCQLRQLLPPSHIPEAGVYQFSSQAAVAAAHMQYFAAVSVLQKLVNEPEAMMK